MGFCPQPFDRVEIYENGDVYNCCPSFLNNYSIGNIYESDFEQIWNSEKAIKLREKVSNGDFSYCSDICNMKNNLLNNEMPEEFKPIMQKYPTDISISTDNSCNVRCRICRDEFRNTKIPKEIFEERINKTILPMFKDAEIVRFGCSGEPFASEQEMTLIKKTVEAYPNIKFLFHTNGTLLDKKLLDELGIYNNIHTISVSMHSRTRETYEKVVIRGDYEKLLKNLDLYSKMREENKIEKFRMIFVVFSDNYHEMIDFVEFAHGHNAIPEFWAFRQNDTELGQNYDKFNVLSPEHPEHKKLLEILSSSIFDSDSVILYPELKELRKVIR